MGSDERTLWLTKHTGDLLGAMVIRDPVVAEEAMDAITEKYGETGVLTACYTAAEIARRIAFPNARPGDGTLSGDSMIAVEQAPNVEINPHQLWAARFLAAYINGDTATLAALFFGSAEGNIHDHADGVIALLAMCADLMRDAMDVK